MYIHAITSSEERSHEFEKKKAEDIRDLEGRKTEWKNILSKLSQK